MTISLSIYQNIQLGRDAATLPLLLVSIGVVFITVFCGQIISMRKRAR
jgi:ABC-type molybdate transport system permease subunit